LCIIFDKLEAELKSFFQRAIIESPVTNKNEKLMRHQKIILFLLVTIIILPAHFFAQKVDVSPIKKTAISHMNAGRYGEAIDQLNKYISANPQEAEAYYFRGISFEKRQQYLNARLDYRRAIALEKSTSRKSEYEKNLARLIEFWYAILNKKIQGHQREIAINANNAFNYLEIGKCNFWMEKWSDAEKWYDDYLARDDNASPDEIIRYTEILAKTGSIVKGEKILKKYLERYPNDWRLWSRYGYFTMWLGKYSIAKKAFETALGFKPFFKEAQDGLDMVTNQAYLNQQSPRAFEKEYPIDRYYRLLRRKPNDIDTRFKLVDELITANRMEEAYDQLKIIGATKADDARYQQKWDSVSVYRVKTYNDQLSVARAKLQEDPTDKESLKKVAQYYEYLAQYDSAMTTMDKYFAEYPDEKDPELKFKWAKICAWNREFDKAIQITDELLKDYPENSDYQLFRAQVSVWINRDIELARSYLDNVLKKHPDNVEGLVTMGSLKLIDKDYTAAQEYADKAKEIDPSNDDVIKLQSNIDWQILRSEEEKLYAILEQGRSAINNNDCEGALPFYEDYLGKAEPNVLILKEYGDVLFCAKNYEKALSTYNEVLAQGANYDAQMQRAKLYYAMSDSLTAVKEFKDLVKQDSSDFDANLYLADSYAKVGENDSARVIYNNLLDTWQLDSTQTVMVSQRKGWLPITGLAGVLETFPNYIGLAPSTQYYSDNLSFRIHNFGARLELGLTKYLSLTTTFSKTYLRASEAGLDSATVASYSFTGALNFTTFKGGVILRLSKDLNMGAGIGSSSARGSYFRDERDAFVRFEKRDTISVGFNYQSSDGSMILYSPYLIDNRTYANLYKLDGYYKHRTGMKISSSFQYITVSDDNEGNDFVLRIGKYIYRDLIVGYEYNYSNYKYDADYYYSPTNFESHSIWIDNELENKENLRATLGGKLGFIRNSKFLLMEGHFELYYKITKDFLISGKIGAGSTTRDDSSYRYFSGQLSAYWTIF
jgi:tetratricopeptide (TPR) repeat protein